MRRLTPKDFSVHSLRQTTAIMMAARGRFADLH
jgi:hypothetical protein